MSVGEDARITATVTATAHNAAPRAPPSVDPLRTASMATGRIGAPPSTRGSVTTTQTPAARHAANTRPPNQVSSSAYRPLSAYLSVCLSVFVGRERQPYQSGPGEKEKGHCGEDLEKRTVNVNFQLNINFPAIPVKQFLYNQQSYPDIIYRHLQSSLLLVDAPFRPLYTITGWLIDWSF